MQAWKRSTGSTRACTAISAAQTRSADLAEEADAGDSIRLCAPPRQYRGEKESSPR